MDGDRAGRVLVDHSRCLRCRLAESGCGSCREICPRGAIDTGEGVRIRADSCGGCLLCTTVCPSGALESSTDFEAIRRDLHTLTHPVLGCPQSGFPVIHASVACLGELSVEHLLSLAVLPAVAVTLACDRCAECPNRKVLPVLAGRISFVESIDERFRGKVVLGESPPSIPEETVSRRGFFSRLGKTLVSPPRRLSPLPPTRRPATARYADKVVPLRRRLLEEVRSTADVTVGRRVSELLETRLVIDDRCTRCMGCVAICPTGALFAKDQGSPPRFDPGRCTGCGLCTLFCLDGAIEILSPRVPPSGKVPP